MTLLQKGDLYQARAYIALFITLWAVAELVFAVDSFIKFNCATTKI
jgi:hypothetical protein